MILQLAFAGVLIKRGRAHPVNDSEFFWMDFDVFDQPTDKLHPCWQIGRGKVAVDASSKGLKLAQDLLEGFPFLLAHGRCRLLSFQRDQACPRLLQTRLEFFLG